jgi:hemoglobin-like flavoprotein
MITKRQIELIEKSWDFVITNTDEAGMIFYSRLFYLDPSLRSLFKEDLTVQSEKLVAMITFIVHKLRRIDDVMDEIRSLGQRHTNYNVKKEHFQTVGQALLWMLEKNLHNRWNEELKNAWKAVYDVLATTMMRGFEHNATITFGK